jgi:hypothetical protein
MSMFIFYKTPKYDYNFKHPYSRHCNSHHVFVYTDASVTKLIDF